MEGAGRGRWWVVAGPVKRRPPFKRSYFNSFSAPAWDFGVKVSTGLISFQWEDSAFRHRRSNGLGRCGKKNGEVGSYKEPPSGPLMSDNPLLVGVFPLLTLSHRPRTRCVTQEVWERGRGVRGDADGPSAKLIPRVSCQKLAEDVFWERLPLDCRGAFKFGKRNQINRWLC